MSYASALLRTADWLAANPDKHIQGVDALDATGVPVPGVSRDTVYFSALGRLMHELVAAAAPPLMARLRYAFAHVVFGVSIAPSNELSMDDIYFLYHLNPAASIAWQLRMANNRLTDDQVRDPDFEDNFAGPVPGVLRGNRQVISILRALAVKHRNHTADMTWAAEQEATKANDRAQIIGTPVFA